MIRLLKNSDEDKVFEFLQHDTITNYFILQGLQREKYKKVYEKKWGEFNNEGKLLSVLLKRRTGNMQFFSETDYDISSFIKIMKEEEFQKIIGERNVLSRLIEKYGFSNILEGSFISKLESGEHLSYVKVNEDLKKVDITDIDRIIELYKEVFQGFTPRELMAEKYLNNTGRGYYIEKDGKIASIAQSSYEQRDLAIIVGVATIPEYRNKGLATHCLVKLCQELIEEGKVLYLQYDNPSAGRLYKELGFNDTGRMLNCFK